jgi:hypothetical protein
MKVKPHEEQKLTLQDKTNFKVAIKQTTKLSKFSLRKRVTVLKNEWWYWDDIMQTESIIELSPEEEETVIQEDQSPTLTTDLENDTEEILQLFSSNPDEPVHRE